jgi:hypothetical protein
MGRFAAYEAGSDPIVLPIRGRDGVERDYTIPEPLGDIVVKYMAAKAPGSDIVLSDEEFFNGFLGAAYEQMLEDGVSFQAIGRAATTAVFDATSGRETAQAFWESGGNPKAMQDWAKRQQKTNSKPSARSTAAARKTPSRASTSGTTTSRKR